MTVPREPRRYQRREAKWSVSYTAAGGQSGRAHILNVSASGLRFIAPKPLQRGTQMQLSVLLPGRDIPLVATGEVIWTKWIAGPALQGPGSSEVGVRFTKIAMRDQVMIQQYLGILKRPDA